MCVPIFYVGGIKNKEEESTTAANTIATSSGEYGLQILRRWVFQRGFYLSISHPATASGCFLSTYCVWWRCARRPFAHLFT